MSRTLITSDLHLTAKPEDKYRFRIFSKMLDMIESSEVVNIVILGDITDEKDRHPSSLVNRIVDNLYAIANHSAASIYILCGNHDYIDHNIPFLHFLNNSPKIHYFIRPTLVNFGSSVYCTFIPHQTPLIGGNFDVSEILSSDYIFLHHTFGDAIAANGVKLRGYPASLFNKCKGRVISGDVHIPQQVGNITYVGAPHHTKFGDTYEPRILEIKHNGEMQSIPIKNTRKLILRPESIRHLNNLIEDCEAEDHVKVKFVLGREEFCDWEKYRKATIDLCSKKNLSLFGVEFNEKEVQNDNLEVSNDSKKLDKTISYKNDEQILEEFSEKESLPKEVKIAGKELVSEN